MVTIILKEILEKRGKSMYQLSKETGIRPNTVGQWVNSPGTVKSITVDTLDRFCEALDCEIEDIIKHKKDALD